jgi:hypothetical protein
MTAAVTERGYVKVREGAQQKGRRYVLEGRLRVRRVAEAVIDAECTGQGHVWQLGHDGARGWWCSCPARRHCAHLVALQLVVRLP